MKTKGLLLILLLCSLLIGACNSSDSTPQAPDIPENMSGGHTAAPTPKPTPGLQAVLGDSLATFQKQYGAFTLATYLWTHPMTSDPNSSSLSLIVSKIRPRVMSIGLDNLPLQEMAHACDIFRPNDAQAIQTDKKTGSIEYSSKFLAQWFPDPTQDYPIPPEAVGQFWVGFHANGDNPNVGQCSIQIG